MAGKIDDPSFINKMKNSVSLSIKNNEKYY
jgi:hypothetical protein